MRTSLSLAVIIMVRHRVLLEHERRRLRAPDLQEHFQLGLDVGGNPADRLLGYVLNLPTSRGAPVPRLAQRLARRRRRSRRGRNDSMLEIRDSRKTYGYGERGHEAHPDVTFSVADGRVRLRRRALRLRQDDAAEVHRGAARADLREVFVDGQPGHRAAREDGARLPGLQPLADALDDRSQQRPPAAPAQAALEAGADGARGGRARRRRALPFIDHYPWQLSGGMQQRVAIARALAYQPSILLMDEPFASVDAQTRGELEDLVLEVQRRYGITILFVTHDIDESVYLSDRIVVLSHAPTVVKEIVEVDLARDATRSRRRSSRSSRTCAHTCTD